MITAVPSAVEARWGRWCFAMECCPCLSNNHILARSGSAAVGEDTLQPALIDTGCNGATSNIVGDFVGNLVPLGTANVDAAISTARTNVDTTGAIIDVGVPCNTIQTATVGLPVMKSGRTTGFTTGSITSVNTSVSIQYQKGCNSGKKFTISYTNQLVTGAMSAGGDSGSLLLSNDGTPNPVGLLFAGSSSQTIYNPIGNVVSAFQAGGHTFAFVGNTCGAVVAADDGVTASVPSPSAENMSAALQIKVENENALFHIPSVIGVGVGAAENDPTEAVIVVYVDSTVRDFTPKSVTRDTALRTLPTELDGTKVRVILTDPFVAQ